MYHRKTNQLSTTEKFFAIAQNAWRSFLELIFPPRCISCSLEGEYFCASCRDGLPPENTIAVRGVVSLWSYENKIVREAILNLKYRGKKMIARDLAESLYEKLLEVIAEDLAYHDPIGTQNSIEKYILIPIPIHKTRRKFRGYNQSELLAKEISLLGREFFEIETGVLTKTKETPTQVSVRDREKRLKNIRGSFSVTHPEKTTGRNVILIDDVVTTGATLAEARKTLFASGVKRVLAMTIAH